MKRHTTLLLTLLAMTAFAGNSLLCRAALRETAIDAASFTAVRILAGALVLSVYLYRKAHSWQGAGSWGAALALFLYAAGFSYAYLSLSAATGALLLFGAVQATMIGYGLWHGERLSRLQITGVVLAAGGLIALLLPGVASPPLEGALAMLCAGTAWGVYSLYGRGAADPTSTTAGNFLRALPMAMLLLLAHQQRSLDSAGLVYAVLSGALASAAGYVIWYAALRGLTATAASSVQLSVPVIAAVGGIIFLGEAPTIRLLYSSMAVLGGIALVLRMRHDSIKP